MGTQDCDPMVDQVYEFSAPKFFDFINGETDADVQEAELWFETSLSYAPSPFMPKIREGRSVVIESLCDFSDAEPMKKAEGSSDNEIASTVTESSNEDKGGNQHEEERRITIVNQIAAAKPCDDNRTQEKECGSEIETGKMFEKTAQTALQGDEVCTPEPQMISKKAEQLLTASKKNQTARKIASLLRNTSARKPTDKSCVTHAKEAKPLCVRSAMTARALSTRSAITASKTVAATDFARENQAIKRQKLEQGKARQILNVKPQNLAHNKSRLGLTGGATSSTSKSCKEERKMYVREASVPFISTAEMVRKFQYGTRDMELPQRNSSVVHEDATSVSQRRPKLTLTRPKEPEFETSHRVRSIKVKSSAELEEELMANIPKFKARPVNKKILEAPSLPAMPRSTPQLPEFQEFHLKTMERANQNADSSSNASTEASHPQSQWNPHKLTEPKTPRLETLLRARPSKAKTTEELEQEELEKIPRFKARPLNKKIFESKGDMGLFRIPKGHVTKPQEFHFATDERIPPTKSVTDLFDKLSLNSDSTRHDHQIPRVTTPNPFHLNTEERGAEKERKFTVEVMQKQLEEERARIPKATPYPYTTDYPVVPPKPEPKHCTKPEPFQLESLVRHEEEMQKEMEERRRLEKEEAQRRIFKAQPILKEDPLPVPEKERKPLTQVEEFELHVDHRAVDRAEFDKKVKEKEMMYKRYREEYESARLMEEEKAVKQLRRTLVPQARPVPKFDNPFQPQKSSKETTKAKSPKLRVLERRQRRTSASASKMR